MVWKASPEQQRREFQGGSDAIRELGRSGVERSHPAVYASLATPYQHKGAMLSGG
jgi:hypothetical protein